MTVPIMAWDAWEAGLAAELDRGRHDRRHGSDYGCQDYPLQYRRKDGLWVASVVIDEVPPALGSDGRNRAEGRGVGLREATSMAVLEIYRQAAFRGTYSLNPPELVAWAERGEGRRYHAGADFDETIYEVGVWVREPTFGLTVKGSGFQECIRDLLQKAAALGYP